MTTYRMTASAIDQPKKLAVIGAGAWGTTIAALLANNQAEIDADARAEVVLWARREDAARAYSEARENTKYLPGIRLPDSLTITSDANEALNGADAAFIVVPSKGLRGTLETLPPAPAYVSCSKGLERGTLKRLSEVIGEYYPDAKLAALSGPNLAGEIASGLPASATVASTDDDLAVATQSWLNQLSFRVYTSPDIVGVEVCGALKNIIALAAGMNDGLGLGANARATLITRGLAELIRLGEHLGGTTETFYGLAGLGDLTATCSSTSSRNHTAGEMLAGGATFQDLEESKLTTEGIETIKAVVPYAEEKGLELPIATEVYRVIFENKPPRQALEDLMGREVKAEW